MPRGTPNNLPLWRCPKCNQEQRCLANAVAHICPSFKSKTVAFVKIEEGE